MKRIILKSLIMVLGVFLSLKVQAYDAYVNGIYYNLNTTAKTATVTYRTTNYNSYSGVVNIPKSFVYNSVVYNVTSIGFNAFNKCTGMTSVNIPNSVTSISQLAFYHCNALTSVNIPNSITTIDFSVFCGCTSLTSVTIPNSVTSIGQNSFTDCSSLTSITIPSSVTHIGENAFAGCI